MKTADPCPRSWLPNAATLSDNTERWVELHLISIWRHGLADQLRSLAAIERDQWGESLCTLWFIYLMFGPAGRREGIYWNTKPYTLPGSNSLENKDLHCTGRPEIYCTHWPLLKKMSPDGGQTPWPVLKMLIYFGRGLKGLKVYEARNADDETGHHRLRWNIRFLSSESKQWHIPKYADTKTYYTTLGTPPDPHHFLNKPLPMHTKRLVARRWVDFVLCLQVHMHAWLRHAVILMWFHLHAKDPFVFIIITRLEETDLLGLVEMAMPLCLRIKKKQLRCLDVMSTQHRPETFRDTAMWG